MLSEGGDTTYLIRGDIRGSSFSGGPQSGYEAHYGEMYRGFLITIFAREMNEFGPVRYPDMLTEAIAKTRSLINERIDEDVTLARLFLSDLDPSDPVVAFLLLLIIFLIAFSSPVAWNIWKNRPPR